MSEYNKFLSHFNKNRKDVNEESMSDREDTIPVTGAVRKAVESEALPEKNITEEKTAAEEKAVKPEEISLPEADKSSENSDEIRITDSSAASAFGKGRFIKTKGAQFIAVNADNRQDLPTTATKYTDRLLPKIPERKIAEKNQ